MLNKNNLKWQELIQEKARVKIVYTYHATIQMNSAERLITPKEVREIIFEGKIIEKRLEDPRGKTFLLNGKTKQERYVHVVCSPKEDYLAIVTAYLPEEREWKNSFTKRVKIN